MRDLDNAAGPVEYEADTQYPGSPESRDAPGGRTVRRLLQAYARDAVFRDWATAAPIVSRLRQLLGPQIALSQAHHNCVMTKDPRYSSLNELASRYPLLVSDGPNWYPCGLVAGEERPENGCLLVLPGTHVMAFDADTAADAAQLLTLPMPILVQCGIAADAGEAELNRVRSVFFTAGCSAGRSNRSTRTKFSAVFTYHATDNRPRCPARAPRAWPALYCKSLIQSIF